TLSWFHLVPALIRVIRPDARKTVSLQFNAHLKSVRLDFAAGRELRVLNLRQDAQQILHVMTDLMRNYVSFGEFARLATATAKARLDIAEERGVEINAPVVRTIERPHGRLRHTATALHNT